MQRSAVMRRLRELDSVVLFVCATLGLTLVSALVVRPVAEAIEPSAGAMLRASVVYVAVVGWQPLAALAIVQRFSRDKPSFDDGIRSIAARDSLFSVVVALFILLVTFAVDRGARSPFAIESSVDTVARLVFSFATILTLLWLQAIIEELAWRSFVLPRLMRALDVWPGLIVHGALWGLCYSPVFAVTGSSPAQSLGFVLTCALLGVLLGWLRLSTRSIYASAASNATLTICAGLPMFLVGEHTHFSAAFGPAGWLAMTAVITAIICYRPWRATIRIPWRHLPEHVN